MKQTLFFIVAMLIMSTQFVPQVYAQEGVGIGLKPAMIEGPADPGEVREYSVTVSNLSGNEQTLYVFTRDIVGVRDGGVPIFANEGAEKTGFELTEWITLKDTELTLGPGEEKALSFTMAVPSDAAPGSHFGGIFVSMDPPKMRSSGAAVGYEVANIISIRVAGDAVEDAQLRSFTTDNYIYGKSEVEFIANIRNDGNVLVRPFGPLEVFNMFGERVAMLTFNEQEGGVFPGTDREFQITWKDEGPGFGRYQAALSLTYGSEGRKSTAYSTASFWILPMNIIGPALAVLVTLLLITYFGVRIYVRRSISMYGGGTRRIIRGRGRGRRGSSPALMVAIVMLAVTTIFLIILLLLFA